MVKQLSKSSTIGRKLQLITGRLADFFESSDAGQRGENSWTPKCKNSKKIKTCKILPILPLLWTSCFQRCAVGMARLLESFSWQKNRAIRATNLASPQSQRHRVCNPLSRHIMLVPIIFLGKKFVRALDAVSQG